MQKDRLSTKILGMPLSSTVHGLRVMGYSNCVCASVCEYVCVYASVCVYACVCICVCICVCVCVLVTT